MGMLEHNDFKNLDGIFKGLWNTIGVIIALNFILGIGFIAAVLCLVKVLFF